MKSRKTAVIKYFTQYILLTGATRYYYAIYIVFTYFAPFTCCEISIFEVISNLHVQRCKFLKKKNLMAENIFKSWIPWSSWSLFFFQVWRLWIQTPYSTLWIRLQTPDSNSRLQTQLVSLWSDDKEHKFFFKTIFIWNSTSIFLKNHFQIKPITVLLAKIFYHHF